MAENGKFEHREDVFSKAVRAGKRTYFFDVKTTKNNDYFLTITESKRVFNGDGKFSYEKHKVFLYREDFDKFHDGLLETLDFIKAKKSEEGEEEKKDDSGFSDVSFEDLKPKE